MNEADSPNKEAFVESTESANPPQPQQTGCPFYSVVSGENTTIANVPLLAPARENEECFDDISSENAPQQDWVAEPDREQQTRVDAEFKQLLSLNDELRSANDELYNQVQDLTSALAESEKALQWEKKRSSITQSMMTQQAKELTGAQEQIQSLFQQLETATQTVQHQENLIENYKAQLEINQQRLAQLERECTLIQDNHKEQSHQLIQAENACRELRTRLMRQQRQTLQYKAALEKCLDTTVPGSDVLNDDDTSNRHQTSSHSANALLTHTQPIQPWGKDSESWTGEQDHFWEESTDSPNSTWSDPAPNISSFQPQDTHSEESTPVPTQPTDTAQQEVSQNVNNLEEQLESTIQMFFAAHPAFTSPSFSTEETGHTEAASAIWETTATPLADEPESAQSTQKSDSTGEMEDFWLEISQNNSVELQKEIIPSGGLPYDSMSASTPSPVLYPHRPPKKRKSLASVELPQFRQKS
ncbi:MAG: hypothetical protein SAK29_29170 [Scytonema sp. PMC 1069.18]|nr:hypothetical protein [Scytonema sp. PMC 1069.18]